MKTGQAKLIITGGNNELQEVSLNRPRITLGRKAGNDLHFNRPEISSSHAAFLLENDAFFVSDLGSTNGTLMNGARLLPNQKYALQNGDVITIAPYKIEFISGMDMQDTLDDISTDPDGETFAPQQRDGSATIYDMSSKKSTGTEEHKKPDVSVPPPPPPPAPTAPRDSFKTVLVPEEPPAAPPPPPSAAPAHEAKSIPFEEPTKPQTALQEDEIPIDVPRAGADYLWLGLGALFLLLAIGVIVFVLMA